MRSVFIVDDESLIIKSLRAGVDWNRLGFEVVGDAGNGVEACERILESKPDLVFTDIRMPGMSGLEMMKKISEALPNTLFVVMSGYAEFAYVQKALTYGALGYCIKPFDEAEIESILKRAAHLIQRNIWSLETEMLALIDDFSDYGKTRRRELIGQLGFQWADKEGVIVLVSPENSRVKLGFDSRIASFKIGKSKYAYLVPGTASDSVMETLSRLDMDSIGGIGASRLLHSPDEISNAVEEACIALNQYFVTGKNGVYRYVTGEKGNFADKLSKLRNTVSQGDIPGTVKLLDSLEEPFARGQLNIIQAFQVYNLVMYSNAASSTSLDNLVSNYERLIHMFSNVKEMLTYLKTVIKQTEPAAQDAFSDIRNETMRSILEYVNDYYDEDISIQGISRKFNVNPCYTSQLFKKETGMTFTEYITDLRIKCACSLLTTSSVPINEVSEKAGFNDYYYFTRVFKKVIGHTPSQYRSSKIV